MAGPAILKIDIIGDATKALKAMDQVETKAGSSSSKLSGAGKAVAGALGTAAIIGFGKASFSAAEEAAQSAARLDSVFSAMGDTTGNASKAAQDYASSLSEQIGVSDDAIMAGQAQLATFGAVSNEAARTAGIFDRATAAGADLAAAGFGSIETNAVQLGKALQDPTKGMTALAKSGVTFTDAQKDQIKQMQKSGDLLGAQKMVLAAVEGQVKGTAAATATSTEKMGVKFGELQETIGTGLMPVIEGVVGFLTKYMDLLIPIGAAILAVVVAVKAWQAASMAAQVAQEAWNAVQLVFNAIMAANPIMLVVIAIAALIAAVILAYKKVGWFRDFVDASWDAVVGAFESLKDAAVKVFNWIKDNWPLLLAVLTGPFGIAALAIARNWDSIKAAAEAVWDWIKSTWSTITGLITGPIQTASDVISGIWTGIKSGAQAVWDWFNSTWQSLKDMIAGPIKAAADTIAGLISGVSSSVSSIVSAIKQPINAVIRAWNGLEFKIPTISLPKVEVLGQTIGGGSFGGQTIGFPNIPTLQTGGIVMRTGLALVHEGEQFSGVGRSFGGQTVINVNVTTTGLGADSPQIQRAVVNALKGHVSRNGPLDVPVRTA